MLEFDTRVNSWEPPKINESLVSALNERIYQCGCGNCMDRDVNAAVNIREEGRRLLKRVREASWEPGR